VLDQGDREAGGGNHSLGLDGFGDGGRPAVCGLEAVLGQQLIGLLEAQRLEHADDCLYVTGDDGGIKAGDLHVQTSLSIVLICFARV